MPLMTFHYVTMYWEGLKSSKKYREVFQSVFLKSGEKSGKNSDRPDRPLHHQPHNTLFVKKKRSIPTSLNCQDAGVQEASRKENCKASLFTSYLKTWSSESTVTRATAMW